jgi:hypothetical protein
LEVRLKNISVGYGTSATNVKKRDEKGKIVPGTSEIQ